MNIRYYCVILIFSKGDVDYWKSASLQDVVDELDGQRKIISKFANIPIDDIRGSRIPHFEVVGDTTFDAYTRSGITYDSSWVSLSTSALFPFTLDYKVDYPSQVGSAPTQSHPNIWINPIINLRSQDNNECNVLFSCQVKYELQLICVLHFFTYCDLLEEMLLRLKIG